MCRGSLDARIPAVTAAQATDEPALSLAGLRRDYGERTALDGVGLRARRAARRWSCSAPTAPARRRCCGSSPRCCDRAAARCGCSAARCPTRPGSCAAGSATSATSRCSTATSAAARTCASTPACTGSRARPREARIEELLAAVGMERRADERVAELSAGMRQRLAICRCVLHEPELLLLDEPDSNLDAEGRELARGADRPRRRPHPRRRHPRPRALRCRGRPGAAARHRRGPVAVPA